MNAHQILKILQYNVYKRLNAVQIPLLYDEKIKEFHQQKISSVKSSELIPELAISWLADLNHVSASMIIWNRQ